MTHHQRRARWSRAESGQTDVMTEVLTTDQRERFARDGFLVLPDFVSIDACARLRRARTSSSQHSIPASTAPSSPPPIRVTHATTTS